MIFGILLVFGAAVMGMAAYSRRQDRMFVKKGIRVDALLVSSEKRSRQQNGREIVFYENTFRLDLPEGVLLKTLTEDQPRPEGDCVRGYYLKSGDRFRKASEAEKDQGKVYRILYLAGGCWCLLVLLIWRLQSAPAGAGALIRLFAYGFALVFLGVGAYLCFFRAARRNRERPDTHIVRAAQVDTVESADSDGTITYFPVLEYEVYGEARRYQSHFGGTSAKYRQIGRRVDLVINDRTGEIYSLEEQRGTLLLGVIFLLVGLAAGGAVLALELLGFFRG